MILGSAGFFFIGTRATPPCFFIFVPVFLAEPLASIYMFPPWLSAICAYDIFVDILRANIEIIEYIKSEYKIIKRDVNINIPSLTTRISVIISSSSLVLSKASRSLLYLSIHSLRVLASITIMLVFF
jgi:hypothetical protein